MEADRTAPVFDEAEVHVAAPPEFVWDTLADVEAWPRWNPEVETMALEGPLAEGTTFRWKAGPGTIVSTLRLVDRPTAIGWTGKTFGVGAVHVWRFTPTAEGTLVQTEESFHGILARLLRRSLAKTLRRSLETGVRYLKTEAERRAGGDVAPG